MSLKMSHDQNTKNDKYNIKINKRRIVINSKILKLFQKKKKKKTQICYRESEDFSICLLCLKMRINKI